MAFKASICNPFEPKIIELGTLEPEKIRDVFQSTDWVDFLQQMEHKKESELFFSPSFEVENTSNKNGLACSIVGTPANHEWYIFYKRPKLQKRFFGLSERMNDKYVSDRTGQTANDVQECLNALLSNDLAFLEAKFD